MREEDKATVAAVIEAMFAEIARHDDHTWQQIGRCVHCCDCQQRLYQGTIPSSHIQVKVPSRDRTPKATREMRTRWGMDG